MSLREEQLEKLRELKKKQDRQLRNQNSLEMLQQQKKDLVKMAADTELVALKSVDNEKQLRKRMEDFNARTQVARQWTTMIVILFLILGLCIVSGKLLCDNSQQIMANGGFLPGFDPEEPIENLNTPEVTFIFEVVLLGITLAVIAFLNGEFFGAVEGGGCVIGLIVGFLILLAGTGTVFYNLSLVKTSYLIVPGAAVALAIVERILVLVMMNGNGPKLSAVQKGRLKLAAKQDADNAIYNQQAKQESKQQKMEEMKPEFDRIEARINKIKADMYAKDLYMQKIGILHTGDFPYLNRILELMETGMAKDLTHALQLRDSEVAARKRKQEVKEQISNQLMAEMRLHMLLEQQRAEAADRARSYAWQTNFYEVQQERDYLAKLEKYREAQRDYYEG